MYRRAPSYLSTLCTFLVTALVWLATASPIAAESSPIKDLRTPPSPAFVLLEVAPTSIERPTTPKALSTSLLSSATGGTILPQNIAIEVAPYWLQDHPELTFDDYYRASPMQSLRQTLTLSLATTNLSSSSGGTGLGIGARTLLVAGSANAQLSGLRKQLTDKQVETLLIDNLIDDCLDDDQCPDQTIDRLERELEDLFEATREIALQIQAQDRRRVGPRVEVAAAIATTVPDNDIDKIEPLRVGIWITPSYGLESPKFDLLTVGRFIAEPDGTSSIDIGGRIIWHYNDLALSAEAIRRVRVGSGSGNSSSTMVDGTLEYRIREATYLSATVGRNHDVDGRSNLIASAGINIGFGGTPLLDLLK